MKQRKLSPKSLLDEVQLKEAFKAEGISEKHAATLLRNIIQHGVTDFSTISTLPKKALELIQREFVLTTSKVISSTDAKDGSTTKLLIELQDGQRIESVIMRYGEKDLMNFPEDEKVKKVDENGEFHFKSNKRATVCVSSQDHANKYEKIRNVVFMGMGEPLDNYDQVLQAVRGMIDTGKFGLSPSRVSISTVGVVPRMLSLANDLPEIGLALSLHAPNQTLRTQIVPTSKAWHIDRIVDAADKFIAQQNKNVKSHNRRRHVLVEYVIIKDVNDSKEVAHELGALLKGRDVLLNIIPYNPTDVPYDYKTPLAETVREFVEITRNEYGLRTLWRQKLGNDIASACGQLVIESKKCDVGDLEDLGKKQTSTPKKVIRKRIKKETNLNYVKYAIAGLSALVLTRWVVKHYLK
ncbi:sorting nexin [Boothiomyces macroporosus]|uniref:Sorting nexin n=1 Tax=Boothiomyces macroporosus TaxID=261099 RepID=A0AAD5UKS1_9FUNG|nr:sorting nexin [Boothiomyces macroporosus]